MAQQQQDNTKKGGYVSMLTLVILMIVVLTVTVTVITVLIDNTISYTTMSKSDKARANADACVEVAINKVKEDLAYIGNETITTDHGSCEIVSVGGSGNSNRVISASGLYQSVTRKVIVVINTVNPVTSITSWKEVDTL